MILHKYYKIYRLLFTQLVYKSYLKKLGWRTIVYKPLWLRNLKYASLGKYVTIFPNCRIELIDNYQGILFEPQLILEDKVQIHQNAHITCANHIKIEKNVIIVANVTITDIIHPHDEGKFPLNLNPIQTKEVNIGENSQIYNNVTILPGSVIGKNSVVAANSVINGVFPNNVIIAGAPAKVIKLFNEKTKNWEKA